MNEIRNHSKSNKYFIVKEPTSDMLAEAKTLVKGGWGKIQSNGWLVIHNNFRSKFENLVSQEAKNTAIVPEFQKWDDLEDWVFENINNGKASAWLTELPPKRFNELVAGRTISEAKNYAIGMTKEIRP